MKFRAAAKTFGKDLLENMNLPKIEIHFKEKLSGLFKELDFPSGAMPDKFPNLKVAKERGELMLNGKKWKELSFHLESGRIRKFWKELNIKHSLSEEVENTIKGKMKGNSAAKIADLQEELANVKSKIPEYNVPVEKINDIKPGPMTRLKNFLVAAGVITAAVAGTTAGTIAVLNELRKAKGCFLFDTTPGRPEQCKLISRSCYSKEVSKKGVPACNNTILESQITNPNLMLRYMKNKTTLVDELEPLLVDACRSEELKIKEKMQLVKNGTISSEDIVKLIEISDFRDILDNFYERYKDTDLKITNLCSLLDDNDKTSKVCVACNSMAPYSSVDYVSIDNAENERTHCEESPSVWDAICKVVSTAISKVAESLGVSSLWEILKIVGYVFVGILLLAGIGFAGNFFWKRRGERDEISYSELENEV